MDVHVINLLTEHTVNPLGIDSASPRLSWQLSSHRRGCRQTAYRLRVASSREDLLGGKADLWDSGIWGQAFFDPGSR